MKSKKRKVYILLETLVIVCLAVIGVKNPNYQNKITVVFLILGAKDIVYACVEGKRLRDKNKK